MKTKLLSCLFIGLVLSLFGCASATTGRRIDQAVAAQIHKGDTKARVVELLGTPSNASLTGTGKEMLVWVFARSSVKGATFVPVVGLFAGGADTQLTTFQVVLGPDKLVEETLWNDGTTETRLGK
jgi:hypothetical protein